jgi:hypothetical protein
MLFLDRGNRPNFSDFDVYWVAGGKAAHHQTVYDVQGHYQFKYSPFIALLWAAPAALFPGGRHLWALAHYLVTAVGFYTLFYLLARVIEPRRTFYAWLLVVIVFSVGARDELKLGQANLWPYLLVLPAWFVGPRERDETGFDWLGLFIGAAFSLAVQWKLYVLALAPIWLLRARVQVLTGAVLATLSTLLGALTLAHGWHFAWAENGRWLTSLTASSQELLVSKYNVSALGILGKWAGWFGASLGPWAYAIWALIAIGWGVVLLWAERAAARPATGFLRFWSASWAWAGIVLLNPLVWPYWLLFCVPLFLAYVALAEASGLRRAGPLFWIICGLFSFVNWTQNYGIVHAGASFIAVLALMFDAQRRVRLRDRAQLSRRCDMPQPLVLFHRSG